MGTWEILSFHLPRGFSEEEMEKQVSHFVDTWWKTHEKNGKRLMAGPDTRFSYLLEGIACDLQQRRKPGPASCAQVWWEAPPAAPSHGALLWKRNKERRICLGLTGKAGSTGIRSQVFCTYERGVGLQRRLSACCWAAAPAASDGGQPKQPGEPGHGLASGRRGARRSTGLGLGTSSHPKAAPA